MTANIEKKRTSIFSHFPQEVMEILLCDRTTKKNIIWATNDYSDKGIDEKSHIKLNQIYGVNPIVILIPRCQKHKDKQADRTREKAEVFTPSWICNEQNNLIDEAWFGLKDVFNTPDPNNVHSWIPNTEKIVFNTDINSKRTWQDYVNANRLEITCGEAPYLTSRYDTTSGKTIKIDARIGLLDRKLRVIRENVENKADFYIWTQKAFQNIYGFEFSGDNLILARSNLLLSFIDHVKSYSHKEPSLDELRIIAEIVSWNLWQMNGLDFKTPFGSKSDTEDNFLFEEMREEESLVCEIKDWKENKVLKYRSLVKNKGWK